LRTKAPERDEIEVRCGKHQFDSDQNENRVAPAEHSEQSNAEQYRRDNEKKLERRSHAESRDKKLKALRRKKRD
jgi:hypothetical protein